MTTQTTTTKECRTCQNDLPVTEFGADRRAADNLKKDCYECASPAGKQAAADAARDIATAEQEEQTTTRPEIPPFTSNPMPAWDGSGDDEDEYADDPTAPPMDDKTFQNQFSALSQDDRQYFVAAMRKAQGDSPMSISAIMRFHQQGLTATEIASIFDGDPVGVEDIIEKNTKDPNSTLLHSENITDEAFRKQAEDIARKREDRRERNKKYRQRRKERQASGVRLDDHQLSDYDRELRNAADERAAGMYAEQQSGMTIKQIAERHGISRGRVNSLLARHRIRLEMLAQLEMDDFDDLASI